MAPSRALPLARQSLGRLCLSPRTLCTASSRLTLASTFSSTPAPTSVRAAPLPRQQRLFSTAPALLSDAPPPPPVDNTAKSTATAAEEAGSVTAPDYLSPAELAIFNKLRDALQPTRLEVQDISGGCGSMYGLDVVSPRFAGLPVIRQHKLVNAVLAEDIKGWHGVQLKTRAP